VSQQIPGLQWTPSDAAAIHEFLNTPVGRKWLGVLMVRKPRIDLSSTERAALSGALAAGYEAFFNEIGASRVVLSNEPPSSKSIDMVKD
jgi:hypothetical protein